MMKENSKLFLSICIFALISAGIAAVSAWSQGQSWNDNSEHIAAMQAYTAYSGELFKAKMDGAVQYIDTLNSSVSTGSLQSDEQQFLATVASVQSMTTDDTITQAWGTMKTQIEKYRTDLKAALSADKGDETALQTSVNSSVTADQTTIQSLYNAYWTDREKSRLDEFTYNDGRRTDILANLTAKGVDVTSAQQIETQIQALQPNLKAGLDAKDDSQLKTVNAQIDALCKQLSQQIISISWQTRETKRLAHFDNTTIRMQDRLTNLTARGLDVTNAQAFLNEIITLRPQLPTALENHDESTLKTLNSQIVSLDQQFNQALRAIVSEARAQTNRTPMGREMNRTSGYRGMSQRSNSSPV
jgi:DNA-binding transcriptional regulator YbjK